MSPQLSLCHTWMRRLPDLSFTPWLFNVVLIMSMFQIQFEFVFFITWSSLFGLARERELNCELFGFICSCSDYLDVFWMPLHLTILLVLFNNLPDLSPHVIISLHLIRFHSNKIVSLQSSVSLPSLLLFPCFLFLPLPHPWPASRPFPYPSSLFYPFPFLNLVLGVDCFRNIWSISC